MYKYPLSLEITEKDIGLLTYEGIPSLQVSTPPEFQGPPGNWSPEHLYVASVQSCLMTTLLYFTRKKKVPVSAYKSHATGILEKTDKGLIFTLITVDATIWFPDQESHRKAGENLEHLAEKHCLISNSIKTAVKYNLEILVGKPETSK